MRVDMDTRLCLADGLVCPHFQPPDCLVGLVVKVSDSRVADLWFDSRLRQDFSESSHTNDLENNTPVATLPGCWHCRVSAGTGWAGASIL